MITAREVAEWMFSHFETSKYLYQESIVYKIKKEFGTDFVYTNENGNLAIGKDVLKEFRKLSEGKVVWERGDRAWRKLRENETYKGRQVE
ncbi:DUF6953 family protein [Methylocucumis oryzae]|uniref:Membrane protein n=1 Tax=Methylocucumis oryzae TaxID=1632867 RepID=A0A0F3IJL4_9GAMM|nr:hypothetical protein [Methylocucumis oryzae]KJV05739.1 membrane protein [Methylocucumis oryzae]